MAPRAPTWRKSSRSEGQNACVEAKVDVHEVGVRDTKNPEDEITFSSSAWQAALKQLRQA